MVNLLKLNIWSMFIVLAVIISVAGAKEAVLILARGGSKGIPLKNLQKVGGVSLLRRAVFTAKLAGFEDITVSTDHPLIALDVLRDNVNILRRNSVTASDTAPSIWGAAEFLAQRPDVATLVLIQATSPFIKPAQLRNAVERIKHPIPYDCIFSATRSFKLRWEVVNGRLKAINFKPTKRIRRQDWDGDLVETGAFYVSRRALIEAGYFQNFNCTFYEISVEDSLEVDSIYDLHLANTLLKFKVIAS